MIASGRDGMMGRPPSIACSVQEIISRQGHSTRLPTPNGQSRVRGLFLFEWNEEALPMNGCKRLSICYVVPGHYLLSSAGPTRNVLCIAEALSHWADVTVAFRSVLEPIKSKEYRVVEIEPRIGRLSHPVDDSAIRGTGLAEFVDYLNSLKEFVSEQLPSYDIVLEKSWLLSGYVVAMCQRRGLPGIVIENVRRVWNEPLRIPSDFMRYLWYQLAQALVGRYLRRVPLIIVETDELRRTMSQRWDLAPRQIEVVSLGVDHSVFRPLNQEKAREQLGISPHTTILLYVGILDQIHNLTPLLDALRMMSDSSLELHIVGDGVLKDHYRAIAHQVINKVFFHGRVPHKDVPQFIAAADLCLAPYDLSAFPDGQIAYSTLKIPEYMACGRPVVSVPSGNILNLVHDNITGFLFHNHVHNWISFLMRCPSRKKLQKIGVVAENMVSSYSWESTARTYLTLCEKVISKIANSVNH
jgi:glycosyltransferase involved in cell wall biosynthesis